MVNRKYNIQKVFILLLVLSFSTAFSEALVSDDPIGLEAEPAARDFVLGHVAAEQTAQGKPRLSNVTLAMIPTVYVFSPAGDMIYEGGGEVREKNYALLQAMPDSLKSLQPMPGRPNLKAMLDIVPIFKAHEDEILKDRHYVVYAITLKTDHVTKTEQAVLGVRAKGKDSPIDTLVVRIVQ
jgi:hypothetical protein